ncbi:MAG: hypothetical protein IPQ10_05975 [Saprospiraceae bacterium]|nr:hypothetical protein [Saprospiraceae bacterium]MBK7795493.1 hypothetical protein [Saprospiraceae bacterium]MBL0260605.1 hypothetical protein [Saprospiraceae bacterium]
MISIQGISVKVDGLKVIGHDESHLIMKIICTKFKHSGFDISNLDKIVYTKSEKIFFDLVCNSENGILIQLNEEIKFESTNYPKNYPVLITQKIDIVLNSKKGGFIILEYPMNLIAELN